MNFKLFFEAKQEFIAKIQDAIDKVDERPFKELFGDKDRFLVKVYNPKFEQNLEYFDLNKDKFDWNKRTYDGKNINTKIKRIIEHYKGRYELARHKFGTEEFWNQHAIEHIRSNTDIVNHTLQAIANVKPRFEPWVDNQYMLKGSSRQDIGVVNAKYIDGHFPIEEPLDKNQVKQYLDLLLKKEVKVTHIGYLISSYIALIDQKKEEIKTSLELYKAPLDKIKQLKQTIDQNNIFYYLVFSRHPVDVLRMSDHKGISSCHRLDGGMYRDCAIADADNDGGIVYLIKGSDQKLIKDELDSPEIFRDKDRSVGGIQPLGRIRLRRFIDLETGKDFAVPTTLPPDQKYGYFTKEIHQMLLDYTRKHQEIFSNPPDKEYIEKNIVLVGGHYSDETVGTLIRYFFATNINYNVKHKNKKIIDFEHETRIIIEQYGILIDSVFDHYEWSIIGNDTVEFEWSIKIPFSGETGKEINDEEVSRSIHMLCNVLLYQTGAEIKEKIQKDHLEISFMVYFNDPELLRQYFLRVNARIIEVRMYKRKLQDALK